MRQYVKAEVGRVAPYDLPPKCVESPWWIMLSPEALSIYSGEWHHQDEARMSRCGTNVFLCCLVSVQPP